MSNNSESETLAINKMALSMNAKIDIEELDFSIEKV